MAIWTLTETNIGQINTVKQTRCLTLCVRAKFSLFLSAHFISHSRSSGLLQRPHSTLSEKCWVHAGLQQQANEISKSKGAGGADLRTEKKICLLGFGRTLPSNPISRGAQMDWQANDGAGKLAVISARSTEETQWSSKEAVTSEWVFTPARSHAKLHWNMVRGHSLKWPMSWSQKKKVHYRSTFTRPSSLLALDILSLTPLNYRTDHGQDCLCLS